MTRLVLAFVLAACGAKPPPLDAPGDCAGFTVIEATIGDLQAAIRAHRTTCRAIVQTYLDRIRALDQPQHLNAITHIAPDALAQADAIDRAVAAGGALPPLFCASLLVKDNYDTAGMPTTAGSIALANSYPPDDAFVVRKLRAAGAIVLAKTNMAEWAFVPWETQSSSNGITANAYALDRVPAGSSGGTASGVAANLGVAGLGTDTGNSIRGPSARLGLVGMRSTLGLVSRDGIVPLLLDLDVAGPMTRTVEDNARILDAIAGPDPADAMTVLGAGQRVAGYLAALDRGGLRGARIGVVRALAAPGDTDAAIATLFERAIADLAAHGAVVVDPFAIDNLERDLAALDICETFRLDTHAYFASLGSSAPVTDVAAVLASGRLAPYIRDIFTERAAAPFDVPPEQRTPPCIRFPASPSRAAYRADVLAAMDRAHVDAIIYPTWTKPPPLIARAAADYAGDNSQLVAPPTGLPAITVPMGMQDGVPVGLQLLARPFAEATLYKLAYAYEQATHHRAPPPLFTPAGCQSRFAR
jgi:Asp-tRNA(Asn)/Glu-tRNA(Gln) amidotransferase A subunit family amidase